MLHQATAQPIPGIGVQFWRLTKPRVVSLIVFTAVIGMLLATLVIRAELFSPGLQIVDPDFFNQMTTMHGLIMVFHAIMPGLVCFVNSAYEILSHQPGPPLWP